MLDLRCGRYQDTLADVTCDLLCVDAPYSSRTHSGHAHDGIPRELGYFQWSPEDVQTCVDFWHERTRSWFVTVTDHVLIPAWEKALQSTGRYVFAPVPWVNTSMACRQLGDGPASSCCYIIAARPKEKRFLGWGSLPGHYKGSGKKGSPVLGAKPDWLMQSLVSDYSRPGDTVCDPCAGGGTTLKAAAKLGRNAIGSEMDPETWRKASMRLGTIEDTSGLPLFSPVENPVENSPDDDPLGGNWLPLVPSWPPDS